jgi:hypothetical protein
MLDDSLKQKLLDMGWFENCEDPSKASALSAAGCRHVPDRDEALAALTAQKTEDDDLEWANELRWALKQAGRFELRRWNDLADEGRAFSRNVLLPLLRPKLASLGLADAAIANSIEWHVLHMFQEADNFKALKSHAFLGSYLPVYEHGFIPCGWTLSGRTKVLLFH